MEKLIEYYNEYYQKKNLKEYYDYIKDIVLPEKFDSLIFLKDFCKWLVDNDKIDFSREGDLAIELVNLFERKLDNAEGVIALLSISDTPIEDLISYLK